MLSEKRRSDREAMARAVEALAQELGLDSERFIETADEIVVKLSRGDLSIMVCFDGYSSQPDVFVETWNASASRRLSRRHFDDVNPCHGRKANIIAHGFDALLTELRRGFTLGEAAFEDVSVRRAA